MHARTRSALLAAFSIAATGSLARAQATIADDFESPGSQFDPMFSYFGGVQGFGTALSPTTVYAGQSMRVWGNFQPDLIFRSAGIGFGVLSLARPALNVPGDAAFFSVTIKSPQTTGQFALKVNFVEDDDADGVLDEVEADDQWEIVPAMLPINATTVLNVPLSALRDANPAVGNDTLNITTTPRIALTLTLETKTTYPGGMVQLPAEFFVDHVGFYAAAQSIPTTCRADYNASGGLTIQDVFDFLTDWFNGVPRADFNASGGLSVQDVFDFVTAWFGGC